MTQFLVKFKTCVQVSPDDFEMLSKERLFDDDTKLSTIKQWAIENGKHSITGGYKRMLEISLSEPETF